MTGHYLPGLSYEKQLTESIAHHLNTAKSVDGVQMDSVWRWWAVFELSSLAAMAGEFWPVLRIEYCMYADFKIKFSYGIECRPLHAHNYFGVILRKERKL